MEVEKVPVGSKNSDLIVSHICPKGQDHMCSKLPPYYRTEILSKMNNEALSQL